MTNWFSTNATDFRSPSGQRHPLHQISLKAQLLQKADHLPGIAAPFSLGLLQPVQLLQHGKGQDNVVLFKGFQGIWGLNQDVGVQHIGFFHSLFRLSVGILPSGSEVCLPAVEAAGSQTIKKDQHQQRFAAATGLDPL